MYISEEIEYVDENGEYILIDVEFQAFPKWDNDGIGAYEYWGTRYYDKGVDYVSLENDPTWDMSKYTDYQNNIIEHLPAKRWDEIRNTFCIEYEQFEK